MMTAYIWVKQQKLSNTVSKLKLQNKSEFLTEWNNYSPTREISLSVNPSGHLFPQLNRSERAEEKIFQSPTSYFINYFL
jgi:hypothetical protein